jgi:hypothetical protein
MKKVAILQSNYIPWKGYFDLINMVDEFVIFDDVQYTRRDWRNRNQIKTNNGLAWLTIPVEVKGKYYQAINQTIVVKSNWRQLHWKTISQNYSKAKYFKEYKFPFQEFYLNDVTLNLSDINLKLIKIINKILEINTKISLSTDYFLSEGKTDKLLHICQQIGGDVYLSGPSAKDYLDENLAKNLGIKIEWMNYDKYPEYEQLSSPFIHQVSILDLIFNAGPNAKKYMRSFKCI